MLSKKIRRKVCVERIDGEENRDAVQSRHGLQYFIFARTATRWPTSVCPRRYRGKEGGEESARTGPTTRPKLNSELNGILATTRALVRVINAPR